MKTAAPSSPDKSGADPTPPSPGAEPSAMDRMMPAMQPIEQPAGPPLIQRPVAPDDVDRSRQRAYLAYEQFLRDRLAALDGRRPKRWNRDYSDPQAYQRSIEPMRRRLKQMLGFWIAPERRRPVLRENEQILIEEPDFTARRFWFEIHPGLSTYAVELIPRAPGPHPGLLVQHGYSGTPELACGLTATANEADYSYRSLGIRAVRRRFHVLAVCHPTGYGSTDECVGSLPQFPHYSRHYGKNRLHRLALLAGGTLFGLDVMACSRGVDCLVQSPGVDARRIGMYGLSQGGQSAVFVPALDTRIAASVASAWLNHRLPKLIGGTRALCYLDSLEEDKFFSGQPGLFSDADLASMICPRPFAVEAGREDTSVDFEFAQAEFQILRLHYDRLDLPDRAQFIPHAQGHVSATERAMTFLQEHLAADPPPPRAG